jgi:hypothetical protein
LEEEFERGRGRENSGGLLVALLQRVEKAREEGGVAAAAVLELLRGGRRRACGVRSRNASPESGVRGG